MRQTQWTAVVALFVCGVLSVTSCKQKNYARTKSFLALNARVAAGDAPSFNAVAKWFAGASDTASPQGDEILAVAPPPLRDGVVRYVRQQAVRTGEFQRSISDKSALEKLLDAETQEMMDIVLALINPRHVPKTDDLFAALILVPGIRDYMDSSALPALMVIMQRPLNDLYGSMEQERLNYLKMLKANYLSGSGSSQKLTDDLGRNCAWLNAFLMKAMEPVSQPLCAATAQSNGTGGGAVPRFLALFGNLVRNLEWQRQMQAAQIGPQLPGNRPISLDAPNLSVLRGVIPQSSLGRGADYQSNEGPGRSVIPQEPGQANPEESSTCQEGFVYEGNACVQVQPAGEDIISPDDWPPPETPELVAMLTGKANRALEIPGPPSLDCAKSGHRGMSLVICQRYIAYLPKYEDMRSKGFNPRSKDFGLPPQGSTQPKNFNLILYAASPVQNQGSEGACTAFGLTHTVIANMKAFDPNYTFDAWSLWNRYKNPYVGEAGDAAKGEPMGNARVTDIRDLSGADQMVQVLDGGKAIFASSKVDGSWHGAGKDSASLTCGGGGKGHAYSIQGYVRDASAKGGGWFIVKNSWGRWWGEDGYGYLPFDCMNGGDASAQTVEVAPNG